MLGLLFLLIFIPFLVVLAVIFWVAAIKVLFFSILAILGLMLLKWAFEIIF